MRYCVFKAHVFFPLPLLLLSLSSLRSLRQAVGKETASIQVDSRVNLIHATRALSVAPVRKTVCFASWPCMAKVAPQWSLSVSVGAKPTPWSPLSSSLRRQTVTGPDAWKQKEEKSETNWANGYIDREGRDSFENEKRKGLLSFVLTDSADEDPRMNWIYDIINRRNTSGNLVFLLVEIFESALVSSERENLMK